MNASDIFRKLHTGPSILLVANCWDAGSAKVIESRGAPAVATTSAGIAWSDGYADGNVLPRERLLAAVTSIARVIRVPLSVDVEEGYSADPDSVAELVAQVADAGAVGINLEDGALSASLLAAKITKAKMAAARRGVDLFINARTDVYLKGLLPPAERLREVLSRAKMYREAGADGLFVPAVTGAGEIEEIALHAGVPLNVLAWPGLPAIGQLQGLGVKRLSAGSVLAQHVYGRTAALAAEFLKDGAADGAREGAMTHPQLNALFT